MTSPVSARVRWTAAALVVAGIGHGAAAFLHRQSGAAAASFVVAAVVQLALAVAAVRWPGSKRLRSAVVAVTVVLIGAWVSSRTVGVAIGHSHGPEAVGILDAGTVAAELVALLAVVVGVPRRWVGWPRLSLALTTSAVVVTTAAFAAGRPAQGDHHHAEPTPAAAHTPAAGHAGDLAVVPVVPVAVSAPSEVCHDPGCAPHVHP